MQCRWIIAFLLINFVLMTMIAVWCIFTRHP